MSFHFYLAHHELARKGRWAILCGPLNFVAEGPGFNVCLVKDGRVTGTINCALHGISLKTVEELCLETRIPFQYGTFTMSDLRDADEVWLTGTPFCMLPAYATRERTKPWPLFSRVLTAWGELVGVDIAGQIQAWETADQCHLVA